MIVEHTYEHERRFPPDGGEYACITLQLHPLSKTAEAFVDSLEWHDLPDVRAKIREAVLQCLDQFGASDVQVVLTDFRFRDAGLTDNAVRVAAIECVRQAYMIFKDR